MVNHGPFWVQFAFPAVLKLDFFGLKLSNSVRETTMVESLRMLSCMLRSCGDRSMPLSSTLWLQEPMTACSSLQKLFVCGQGWGQAKHRQFLLCTMMSSQQRLNFDAYACIDFSRVAVICSSNKLIVLLFVFFPEATRDAWVCQMFQRCL